MEAHNFTVKVQQYGVFWTLGETIADFKTRHPEFTTVVDYFGDGLRWHLSGNVFASREAALEFIKNAPEYSALNASKRRRIALLEVVKNYTASHVEEVA